MFIKVERMKELALERIKEDLQEEILDRMISGEDEMKLKQFVPDEILIALKEAGYRVSQSIFGKTKETTINWGK